MRIRFSTTSGMVVGLVLRSVPDGYVVLVDGNAMHVPASFVAFDQAGV